MQEIKPLLDFIPLLQRALQGIVEPFERWPEYFRELPCRQVLADFEDEGAQRHPGQYGRR